MIGPPSEANAGTLWLAWLKRAFIGAVTAVVVVGFFLQNDFSEAVGKLFLSTSQSADIFRALMLLLSVSLAAGFAGHVLLSRISAKLLDTKLKALGDQAKISEAAIAVLDDNSERAIELLTPILDNPDVPKQDRARAHGIMANAKKKQRRFGEVIEPVDAAHKLSPDDYRYLFNRACYRRLLSNGAAIDDVFDDLKESLDKGLEFYYIEARQRFGDACRTRKIPGLEKERKAGAEAHVNRGGNGEFQQA